MAGRRRVGQGFGASGSVTTTVVPRPTSLTTSMVPPWRSTVAASVLAVQAQRLVRRLCACAAQRPDGPKRPVGCEACGFTGYRGRIAVHELMRLTPRVRAMVLDIRAADALREAARLSGMRTMFEDGERKVAAGLTTIEEVARVVPPPEVDDWPVAAASAPRVLPFGAG